jgi:ureidoacrylate peracid hydrolase
MQNDFGAKGGMFDRAGIDISLIEQIVAVTGQVIASARRAGMKIIFLKMGFSEDLSDLGCEGSPNRTRHLQFGVGQPITAPDGRPSRILVRDTWNTDIIPQLRPGEGDIVVNKTRYSGFSPYRTGCSSQNARDPEPAGDGLHHLGLRGVDHPRCHVPGLLSHTARRLHG